MDITDSSSQRIKFAVERLLEGHSVSYHGVSLSLDRTWDPPQLRIWSWSDCLHLENVRREEAQEKIQRSKLVVEDLADRSPEFRSIRHQATVDYSFGFDYGTGGVLLAEELGGEIVWKGK